MEIDCVLKFMNLSTNRNFRTVIELKTFHFLCLVKSYKSVYFFSLMYVCIRQTVDIDDVEKNNNKLVDYAHQTIEFFFFK